MAHSKLFNAYEYHETLMKVTDKTTSLEEVQGRVVGALRRLAEEFKGDTRKRILQAATLLEGWTYLVP